jgi:uncharacterized protein YozE (UPF0346 family)
MSKSQRKKLRMRAFNALSMEEQAKNLWEFYFHQQSLPKYQRKLATFWQVWDEKLQNALKKNSAFRNMDRYQAERYILDNPGSYVIRPSSVEGFLTASVLGKDNTFYHFLLAYREGNLCTFSKPVGGDISQDRVYDSKESFCEFLKGVSS